MELEGCQLRWSLHRGLSITSICACLLHVTLSNICMYIYMYLCIIIRDKVTYEGFHVLNIL